MPILNHYTYLSFVPAEPGVWCWLPEPANHDCARPEIQEANGTARKVIDTIVGSRPICFFPIRSA
jgi:hypothetical protein